jgi:outer membrane protein assembly factor BamE (lipoprotein component of BamABCDE complex)
MEKKYRTKALIFLCIMSSLLITGCLQLDYNQQKSFYDITKIDLFAKKDWSSDQVSIMGVTLGMTSKEVISLLGEPDLTTSFNETVFNYEYREKLTLKRIGLNFHFEEGKVARMTLKKPFDRFLKGNTKIVNDKQDLYRLLGRPSAIKILSGFTLYQYDEKGLDVIMDGPKQNGLSLRKAIPAQ